MTQTHGPDLDSDLAPWVAPGPHDHGSILFVDDAARPADSEEPPFFGDLNLRQVVDSILARRDEYNLRSVFHMPLRRVDAVAYRHEVFRDLESDGVRSAVRAFAHEARRVRRCLGLVEAQRFRYEKERWLLEAAIVYCGAVGALRNELDGLDLDSRGLRALRSHLAGYVASEEFTLLAGAARTVLAGLSEVRYTIRIDGARVTVSRYDGEADYTAVVEETFARFREGAAEDHRLKVSDSGSMDHVEAQIVERVARLYPDEFSALDQFSADHGRFLDARIASFDREAQFYLAFAEHAERLADAGISFCYPSVSARSDQIWAEGAVDLALAGKLVAGGHTIVPNDFALRRPERVLVVTGPNQGGKTTFARMVGQLHWLAGLGVPVPARSARLVLPDRIFTHFERVEDISTLRGRLDDELVRVREILDWAGERSLIILNEIFASTTLDDAILLGGRVLERIIATGCPAVCVTFVDELSVLGDATVSMVAAVSHDDPSERTFKIVRTRADGRAYAAAIAAKYGLSYGHLRNRISR